MNLFQPVHQKAQLSFAIFSTILIISLLGSGCGQKSLYSNSILNQDGQIAYPSLESGPRRTPNTSAAYSTPSEVTSTPEEQKKQINFFTANYFAKKIIPLGILSAFGTTTEVEYRPDVDTYNQNDCLGVTGGRTLGGDLLTTFVNNERFKGAIEQHYASSHGVTTSPFSYYTKPYIKNLLAITNGYIQNKYHKDLYSYYICHLDESLDVVAGSIWNSRISPYYFNKNWQGVDTVSAFTSSSRVLIIRKNVVQEFKDIQTVDHTATGAEVYPCKASFQNNRVVWACFSRIFSCSDRAGTAEMYTWNLNFNGTRSERIVKLNPSCAEAEKIYKTTQ